VHRRGHPKREKKLRGKIIRGVDAGNHREDRKPGGQALDQGRKKKKVNLSPICVFPKKGGMWNEFDGSGRGKPENKFMQTSRGHQKGGEENGWYTETGDCVRSSREKMVNDPGRWKKTKGALKTSVGVLGIRTN